MGPDHHTHVAAQAGRCTERPQTKTRGGNGKRDRSQGRRKKAGMALTPSDTCMWTDFLSGQGSKSCSSLHWEGSGLVALRRPHTATPCPCPHLLSLGGVSHFSGFPGSDTGGPQRHPEQSTRGWPPGSCSALSSMHGWLCLCCTRVPHRRCHHSVGMAARQGFLGQPSTCLLFIYYACVGSEQKL